MLAIFAYYVNGVHVYKDHQPVAPTTWPDLRSFGIRYLFILEDTTQECTYPRKVSTYPTQPLDLVAVPFLNDDVEHLDAEGKHSFPQS